MEFRNAVGILLLSLCCKEISRGWEHIVRLVSVTSHPALPRIPLQFPLAALGQASERHHSRCGTRGLCGQYPPALDKPRKLIPAPLAFPSHLEPWSQHTGNSLRKGRMAPSQTFLGPSFRMPPFDRNQEKNAARTFL